MLQRNQIYKKTEHSNSRLCIGLQLQAQKLLMITVKFR